jgi:hypothetical protein
MTSAGRGGRKRRAITVTKKPKSVALAICAEAAIKVFRANFAFLYPANLSTKDSARGVL